AGVEVAGGKMAQRRQPAREMRKELGERGGQFTSVLRDEPSTARLRRSAQSLLRMSGYFLIPAHPEERLRSRGAASRRRVSKDLVPRRGKRNHVALDLDRQLGIEIARGQEDQLHALGMLRE